MRDHCLSQDPGATSSTQRSSVLSLNAWSCKKIFSPQAQEFSTRVKTDPDAPLVRRGRCSKSHCRFSRGIRKETRYFFSDILFNTVVQSVDCAKNVLASTTGIQDPDMERKMSWRSRSKAGGTSSRYKKYLSMSTMTFLLIGSTRPTLRAVRFSLTRKFLLSLSTSFFSPS